MPVPRSPVSAPQATLPASLCRTPPPSWPGVQGLPPGEAAPGAPVAMGAPHLSVPADGGPRAGPERGQQAAGGRAAGPRRDAPGIPRPRRASARAVPKPTAGQNQLEWLPGGRVGNGGGGARWDGGGLHPPPGPGRSLRAAGRLLFGRMAPHRLRPPCPLIHPPAVGVCAAWRLRLATRRGVYA